MSEKKKVAKKRVTKLEKLLKEDETLLALTDRYFRLYKNENIGKTGKMITTTLDKLEASIIKRKEELKNESTKRNRKKV